MAERVIFWRHLDEPSGTWHWWLGTEGEEPILDPKTRRRIQAGPWRG